MKPRQDTIDLQVSGRRLAFQLPLLDVRGARALTGLDEDELMSEIGQRRILWAWNIALQAEGRTELRIWNRSLVCWIEPNLAQPRELKEVLLTILPAKSELTGVLDSKEVKRLLNTGHTHIANLCERGQLTEHGKSGQRAASGPNGKRIITRASVIEFFRNRQIT